MLDYIKLAQFNKFVLLCLVGLIPNAWGNETERTVKAPQKAEVKPAQDAINETKAKKLSRFDQLFVWKMSNDLDLDLGEEKKFTDFLENIIKERHRLQDELELLALSFSDKKLEDKKPADKKADDSNSPELNAKNSSVSDNPAVDKAAQEVEISGLLAYQALQEKIFQLNLKETNGIEQLLGEKKTLRYLRLKHELQGKLKELLTDNKKSQAKANNRSGKAEAEKK